MFWVVVWENSDLQLILDVFSFVFIWFLNNDSSGSLLISNYFHLHSNYDDIIWAWSTCILYNSLCKLSCSRSRSSTRPGHVLSSLISLLLWEISNNKYETKMNSLGKYSFEKKSCEFSQLGGSSTFSQLFFLFCMF